MTSRLSAAVLSALLIAEFLQGCGEASETSACEQLCDMTSEKDEMNTIIAKVTFFFIYFSSVQMVSLVQFGIQSHMGFL